MAGRARLGHKARADRLGQVGQAIAERRRKAGDSTPRASRTLVPSAPGRGAAQDAPADLADLDRGHAPADMVGHVPPAVAVSVGPDLPGQAGFATQNRADPKASADLDRGHAPADMAGHVPPAVAGFAISGRAARVRQGRALAAGRRGHPHMVLTTASPSMVAKVPRARRGASGDPPKGGLRGRPDPMGTPRVGALAHRGMALTGDGTRATAQVRPGRALARAQIPVEDRARRGPASGSVAADHRLRHPCPAGDSRSASTETPMRPSKPISTRPIWSSRLPTPRRPPTPIQSTQASPLRLGRHSCSGRPGRTTEPALAVIRAQQRGPACLLLALGPGSPLRPRQDFSVRTRNSLPAATPLRRLSSPDARRSDSWLCPSVARLLRSLSFMQPTCASR